jgi:hypothetical protein
MRKDCKSFVESDTNSDLRLLLIASIARVVVVNKISVRETLSSSGEVGKVNSLNIVPAQSALAGCICNYCMLLALQVRLLGSKITVISGETTLLLPYALPSLCKEGPIIINRDHLLLCFP